MKTFPTKRILGQWPALLSVLLSPHLAAAPAMLLFEDEFNETLPGWTAVQPPGSYIDGPLRWQWDIVSQAWVETSNIYTDAAGFSPTATAAMLINDAVATGAYTFKARLNSGDDDGFGLIFGYQDAQNFYRVSFGLQNRPTGFPWTGFAVDRRVDGVVTNLFGGGTLDYLPSFTFTRGVPFDVTISVSADQKLTLTVVDDPAGAAVPYELVTAGALPSQPNGQVGLMVWGMSGGVPRGIQVGELSLSPTALVNNPPAGVLTNWTPVVPLRPDGLPLGGHGQGIWSIALGANGPYGTLNETSDALHGNDAEGQIDFVTPTLVAGENWTNYVLNVRIIPGDDDGHGVVLRYLDDQNFYRIALRAQTSGTGTREGLSIQKVVGGVWEEIYFDETVRFDPPNNVPYDILAAVNGDELQVLVVADPLSASPQLYFYGPFTITGATVPRGKVGVFSWAQSLTQFDFVRVYGIEGVPLLVRSSFATADPASGLNSFPAGSSVTATVPSPFEDGPGIRRIATGWTGFGDVPANGTGASTTFNLNNFSIINWTWATEYKLTVNNAEGGTVNISGEQWLPAGTNVTITATPNAGFIFTGWQGGSASARSDLSFTANQPLTLTPRFEADSDGDNLPDTWEQAAFGDLQSGGAQDNDSDGISNLAEFLRGSNPSFAEQLVAQAELNSRWENAQRDPILAGEFMIQDFAPGYRGLWEGSNDHHRADDTNFWGALQLDNASFDGPRVTVRSNFWNAEWKDYTVEASFTVGDDDGNCLYWRYQNQSNWYRVTITGENNDAGWRARFGVSVHKRVDGVFTELAGDQTIATDPTDLSFYKRVRLTVIAQGSDFSVKVAGWNAGLIPPAFDPASEVTLSFSDNSLAEGGIAVGPWGQGAGPADVALPVLSGVLIDDIVVRVNNEEVFRETWDGLPLPDELPSGWENPLGEGNWRVSGHHSLVENSNFGTATSAEAGLQADAEGTLLLGPNPGSANYLLELGFHAFDDDGVGFIYDYVDTNNYSRVLFVSEASAEGRVPRGVNVTRKSNGNWNNIILGDTTFVYTPGAPFTAQLAKNNGQYTLSAWPVDAPGAAARWNWTDPGVAGTNRFGLAAWASTDAHFTDARAWSIPAGTNGPPVGEIRIAGISRQGNSLTLQISKPAGTRYNVEESTTLQPGSWTPVVQNRTEDSWTAALPASGHAFWRIRSVP